MSGEVVREWLTRLGTIGVRVVLTQDGGVGLYPPGKTPPEWLRELQQLRGEFLKYLSPRNYQVRVPHPPPSRCWYRRAISPSSGDTLLQQEGVEPLSLDDPLVAEAAQVLDWQPAEAYRLPPEVLAVLRLDVEPNVLILFREGAWAALVADQPLTPPTDSPAPSPTDPPETLWLRLPGGCGEGCRLRGAEVVPVTANPFCDQAAIYRCAFCGREYRLIHEFGRWMHPTAEGAILPDISRFPDGWPIPGWPRDVEAPAWVEDALRDFADVIIRAGRQLEHGPEVDCAFPVAILWCPQDGAPQWACIKCGTRPRRVDDGEAVVDGFNFPIPGEEREPTAPPSASWPRRWNPGPLPYDERRLVEALGRWARENGWPAVDIGPGGRLEGGETLWNRFLSYLSTRQPTETADKTRERKLRQLADKFLSGQRTSGSVNQNERVC